MPPNYTTAGDCESSRKMILALIIIVVFSARPAATAMQPSETCQRRCGDIEIPYPFGIGPGCHLETGDWTFVLSCNRTADGRLRVFNYEIEVLDMSVRLGQLRIWNSINPWCYNGTTRAMNNQSNWEYNMSITNYRINDAQNRFTVIGCNSLAYISSLNDATDTYMTGCMAMCPGVGRLKNGSCAGVGCCQTAIPSDLNAYDVSFEEKFNTSRIANFSPCSYAVLVEAAAFDFRTTYVTTDEFMSANGEQVPLVLDWAIGNQTCEEAKRNASAYACVSSNSECVDSKYGRGRGYLCNCSAGYEGNPYLLNGCQDINECEHERLNYPCSVPGTCTNTVGSFYCSCPDKMTGNAYNGTCEENKSQNSWQIAIGVSSGVVVLILTASCLYMIHEKRRFAKIKTEYFKQHGGLLLFEEMKSRQGLSFTLFTQEELEVATNRFDERNVIGKGGNGTVYRGTTKDGETVAIKKSRLANERQKTEFGKEMLILSQINHRNIVKLYGCCLEVEVPMLVYKYIPNGTLYRLIHGRRDHDDGPRIPFSLRLKIAHQTAEALAYLYSWASPPIIHGDVKTSNILLDEDYTAMVTDFGASTVAPTDEAQLVTFVQGTCGYLDPEYMRTCKLTDKSDVYSFGVVLLELLTCRKALNLEGLEEEKYLSSQFLLVLGDGRLEEILDEQLKSEQSLELLEQVAELAKQCLEMASDKRPSMRQVAEELDKLSRLSQHPWGRQNSEEILALLGGSPTTTSEVEHSSTRNISSTDTAYIGITSPR
ncbi:putative wall-associated receptor kinase-like 16 [Phragmites australis]|uniref:putative wall-associated receptor kinase-like 16 n=1 Tax=Phragmites australis TaxID=29695 RepID=UPI002D76CA06|nr:putative wall-associated receptor kinase-like 16 [Phragmites australis]